ncbi:MAG: hypothetical protein KDB16_14085, partial [Acidimicrobiales bacterium]|nr:hypothetical protein [Acidimicrobiales bacterium]
MTDEFELQARRSKMAQIRALQDADELRQSQLAVLVPQRRSQEESGQVILEEFWRTGDVVALRDQLGQWAHLPGFQAYGGVNGQMFLNQLVGYSPDQGELSRLLMRCLRLPSDDRSAAVAISDLVTYTESIKKGAHPAPRRSVFFLSFFWALQDHDHFPCFWPSAEGMTRQLGWLSPADDLGELYLNFRELMLSLGEPEPNELALFWASEGSRFIGINPTILERCRRNLELNATRADEQYPDSVAEAAAASNARAIVGELAMAGSALADRVAEALGRSVKAETPSVMWSPKAYRGDGWVRWGVMGEGGSPSVSMRVWVTASGMFIGLHPGWYRSGWYDEARLALQASAPATASWFNVRFNSERVLLDAGDGAEGEFLLGWHLPRLDLSADELADLIVARSADLQPAVDKLVALVGGPQSERDLSAPDPLLPLVKEFITTRPYPTAKDDTARSDRAAMAALLASDEVQIIDLAEFRRIYNGNRYGSPGPQSGLNTTLRDATPAELQEYFSRIHYLLWGEGDDADRIDALLDPERLY